MMVVENNLRLRFVIIKREQVVVVKGHLFYTLNQKNNEISYFHQRAAVEI